MNDYEAMVEAASGMNAIVHLALSKGREGDTPVQRSRVTVDENIPGDFNIFEAARINFGADDRLRQYQPCERSTDKNDKGPFGGIHLTGVDTASCGTVSLHRRPIYLEHPTCVTPH